MKKNNIFLVAAIAAVIAVPFFLRWASVLELKVPDPTVGEYAIDAAGEFSWVGVSFEDRYHSLEELLGQKWDIKLVPVNVGSSKIAEMNPQEVLGMLGEPDSRLSYGPIGSQENFLYKLGFLRRPSLFDRLGIGPGSGSNALLIYFDPDSNLVSRISILD